VVAYAAPVAALIADLPGLTAFPHWPPLEIARSLWAEGGIGPARIAVMDRVAGANAALLGRTGDRPAGVAFVACHGAEAMLHALEVAGSQRRNRAWDETSSTPPRTGPPIRAPAGCRWSSPGRTPPPARSTLALGCKVWDSITTV
jgi:hypothetical protein